MTRIIIIKYINICNYQINKSNKFGNHSIQIQQDIYQFNHFVTIHLYLIELVCIKLKLFPTAKEIVTIKKKIDPQKLGRFSKKDLIP